MAVPPPEEKHSTTLKIIKVYTNGAATTNYKESRDVGRPVDAPLLSWT
jgi:hypothetical protein